MAWTTFSAVARLTLSRARRHCSAAQLGATQRWTLTVRSWGCASICGARAELGSPQRSRF